MSLAVVAHVSGVPEGKARRVFQVNGSMALLNRRYHSLFLLSSVLLFFVATPFLETQESSETLAVLNLYLTLVAATVKLSERHKLFSRLSRWRARLSGFSGLTTFITPRRLESPAVLA
jgi:hypothetical protein